MEDEQFTPGGFVRSATDKKSDKGDKRSVTSAKRKRVGSTADSETASSAARRAAILEDAGPFRQGDGTFLDQLGGNYGGVLAHPPDPDDDSDGFQALSYNQLLRHKYTRCYACDHINAGSLRENPDFVTMMRLYTDNASSTYKEASYRQIKEYFDQHCKEFTDYDWDLPCIREHFERHTQFPTDEIMMQLHVLRSIRDKMLSTVVSSRNTENGEEIKPNNNNIKNLLAIQKEIRELMLSIKNVNSMAGFDPTLQY